MTPDPAKIEAVARNAELSVFPQWGRTDALAAITAPRQQEAENG